MAEVLTRDKTDWSELVDQSLSGVIQSLKSKGWKVVSLRPGDISEIVLSRSTKFLTVIAQDQLIATVHVFDTANH